MKAKAKVMWWDASGNAQISETMPIDVAVVFLDSMLPEQEARLVRVGSSVSV